MCCTLEVGTTACNAAVSACETEAWERALSLLIQAQDVLISVDVFTFTAAIAACSPAGLWMEALGLLRRLQCSGIGVPDVVICDAAVGACDRSGKHAPALAMLDEAHLSARGVLSLRRSDAEKERLKRQCRATATRTAVQSWRAVASSEKAIGDP
eukprot:UN0704